jgi:hypothetical protein
MKKRLMRGNHGPLPLVGGRSLTYEGSEGPRDDGKIDVTVGVKPV